MAAFVDLYERWLGAAGYKADTVERALRIGKGYLRFCQAHQIEPLSRDGAESFLVEAGRRQVKPHTRLNYWKEVRKLFQFAVSQGLCATNPTDQIPRPRLSLDERERDIEPLTPEDRDELLAVCAHWNWVGLRDRAIVWVLWTTGVRAGEVCSLEADDVDWVNEVIRVRSGKAGVRYEPILEYECATAIRQYQLQRPHEADNLFVDIHGGPFTRHALEQLCRRLAKRAGWPSEKPSFPHAWRHSARNRMRDLGLDDTDVSALLGHKSVVATRGYARRAASNLAKARLRLALEARRSAAG